MDTSEPVIDIDRKYVRVVERRADGLVEFEFAIGEPELCAELLLPADAFESFCAENRVIRLAPREASAPTGNGGGSATGISDWSWNLHQATHQRFR